MEVSMNTHIIAKPSSLQTPVLGACKHSGWTRQFGRPTGVLGWAIGHLMAVKNSQMNRLAVELLNVQPDDQVLEIGFGPGTAIQMLATRATKGFVAGVDLSEVMVKQAARRNRKFIKTGQVELRQGTVSNLPYEDGRFTKVCAVNNFYIWPTPEDDLKEVRRVMKEGGLLLLCLRMKHPSRSFMVAPGFTESEVEEVQGLLRRVGFRHVRTEVRQLRRGVTCVLANR